MKKIFAVLIFLVAVAFLVFYLGRNLIVERAVEAGGEYALGVETSLASAEVGLTHGRCELNKYKIDNPEGFEQDNFLTINKFIFDIETGSIFDDAVVIDSFIVDGLVLNLEQNDAKGNYKQILDHIKKLDMNESSEEESKVIIKKASFSELTLNTALTIMGKKQQEGSYTVEGFELNNIGGDEGMTTSQLTAFLVKTLINKALSSGKLPANLSGKVEELKNEGQEKLKEGLNKLFKK